jgi:aurora kinase
MTEVSTPEPYVFNGYIVAPQVPKSNWTTNDFEMLHRLGSGQYGEVWLATVKGTNFVCAIKILNIAKLVKFDVVNQLRREIEIAFHTRHKYLLRTYTYFFDSTNVYLVLEPCSKGMLYSELQKVKRFDVPTSARFVAQLGEALLYLHQHHILHRDIKPENILLDHNNNIKLADFGWSVHDPSNRRQTGCGTPEYFPPEICEKSPYSATADLWCLGVFCYELLIGSTPFVSQGNTDPAAVQAKIRKMEFEFPPELPADAKDLIASLLQRDGSKRLALSRVLSHPFLMNNYYLPQNLQPPSFQAGKRSREEEWAPNQ